MAAARPATAQLLSSIEAARDLTPKCQVRGCKTSFEEKEEHLAPLAKQGRRHADRNDPNRARGLEQPLRHDSRVVVLGIMYPNPTSQPVKVRGDDLPELPDDAVSEGQTAAVIFYDPMSAKGSHDLPRYRASTENMAQNPTQSPSNEKARTRADAIAAVARELARLSRSTRQPKDALN